MYKGKVKTHRSKSISFLSLENLLLLVAIVLVIMLVATSFSYAAPLTPADEQKAAQQNQILLQQQEQELQDINRQIEKQSIQRSLEKKSELPAPELEVPTEFADQTCFTITEIDIQGADKISKRKQNKLTKPYLNKCLTLNDINNLLREITNYYIKKGYITSRAFLTPQNLATGKLTLVVVEGYVKDIKLDELKIQNSKLKMDELASPTNNKKAKQNNSKFLILNSTFKNFRQKSQIATAFSGIKNEVLNIRDIEQGLDQMNRLQSNNATLNIEPGKDNGTSNIVINNSPTRRTHLTIGTDNYGQKSTGERRRVFSLSQDNLLGLNDEININYNEDLGSYAKAKHSELLSANISIPYGYWTFKWNSSYSECLTTIEGEYGDFTSTCNTKTHSPSLERMIYRSKKYKTDLGTSLEYKDTESYLNYTLIPTQSRKLSVASLYSGNTLYINKGILYVKPTYSRGLHTLGAKEDKGYLDYNTPHAQFDLFKFYTYLGLNFNIPKTSVPFKYNFTFDGQYSLDPLFSSEQFSAGGLYSVRGFKESNISGDSGFSIRNDLKIKPTDIIRSFTSPIINNKYLNNKYLRNLELLTFYDYGMVRSRGGYDKDYVSGAGAGVKYYGNYWNADLTYSKSLHTPVSIEEENQAVYFSLNFKI